MRRKIRGLRALVTGASSGIGRELARELARQGAELLITARRGDRLEALAQEISSFGAKARQITGDITDDATRRELIEVAREQWGGLDILVNNAGLGAWGPFAEASADRLRQVMEVNFFAPAELVRLAIPLLSVGTQPMVVNIGSVLGHRSVPNKSEYCASKFALHGWSDALRSELQADGIDVLLVSPSTTESEFFDHVIDGKRKAKPGRDGLPAGVVARRTVAAIARGNHEIILTPGGKALVWLDRLCPRLAHYLVTRFSN